MNYNYLLVLPVIFPICAALLSIVIKNQFSDRSFRQRYVGVILVINLLLVLAALKLGDRIVVFQLTETLPVLLKVDGMSVLIEMVVSVMWLLSGIFSFEYMKHEERNETYYVFFLCTLGALCGLGFAGNYLTLYMFFEAMTFLSFPLVLHTRTREAISAGLKYLFYSIFGASLALIGLFFAVRYCTTIEFTPGGTLDMAKAAGHEQLLLVIFFLVIVGFGAKAGMFPLHAWLPTGHPVAPAPASAVLSGVITKAGVLAITRVVYFIVGTDFLRGTWVQYTWMTLTLITVFMGSMLAYKEQVLKKRLAYSTVSQVSYILFGLSTMTSAGMAGALLHVVTHSIVKDMLFFCAGAIIYKTHCTRVDQLTAIGKKMPVVMWCFTIGGLALVGVPPMVGFASKWYLATGSLASDCGPYTWIGPAVLLTSAFLTAGYLLTISIKGFLPGKEYDYSSLQKCEPNLYMTIPVVVLASAAILIGLYPSPFLNFFHGIAASVM